MSSTCHGDSVRVAFALVLMLLGMSALAADVGRCAIYDGTVYVGKPVDRKGLLDIHIVYEGDLWDPRLPKAPYPSRRRVEVAAKDAAARNVPLVLDIERWRVDNTATDEFVRQTIAKLVEIIGWARQAAPTVKLGYFSLAPMGATSWAMAPPGSRDHLDWRRTNDRMRPLAEAVDIIFPYAYTFKYNPEEWQAQAIGNIAEARRYGKPVYLFIWPQYTERNKELGYTFVPSEFWRRQLSVGCEHADGVVIWGGWDPKLKRRAPWDDTYRWYRDVQDFVAAPRGS